MLLLLACSGPAEDSGAPPASTATVEVAGNGVDDDADGCVDEALVIFAFEPRQEDTLLSVFLSPPPAAPFSLGLVATDGWEGEACREGGDCHVLEAAGAALRIVADPGEVVLGETTLFDSDRLATASWVVRTDRCQAGGADPAAYPECCFPD